MMNEQQLLDLKHQIDQAKSKAAELKGEQKSLMQQLKKDWECDTIAQAEKNVKEMEKEITTLDDKIKKGVEELEERYEV